MYFVRIAYGCCVVSIRSVQLHIMSLVNYINVYNMCVYAKQINQRKEIWYCTSPL